MSDLQQRYGTPSKARRRTLVVISTLVGALFLGWLTWVIAFRSDPAIEAEVASYEVVSVHEVRIKVDARFRDDHVNGSCLFRATARDHSPVGDLTLTVAQIRASHGGWIPVKTLDRATTVERVSCTDG